MPNEQKTKESVLEANNEEYAVILSGFVLVFILSCSTDKALPPVKQGDYASVQKYLTEYINQEMKRDKVVGLSIGLIDDQQLVWAQGFGYADKEQGIPATSQTIYRIGSISKLFTAISVMQLEEQGKIDIDKPLQTYLPEFSIKTRFPDAGPITPRTMMTHHSGIPQIFKGYYSSVPPSMVLPILKESYAVAPPNFIFIYSDQAVSLLGQMVESVSGKDFVSYMDEKIFAPMGMAKSSFDLKHEMKPLLSLPYESGKAQGQQVCRETAAGRVYSNVEDLSKLPMMVFADGMSGSNRILKPETLKKMLTVQNDNSPLDFDVRVGLNWFLSCWDFPKRTGHIAHHGGEVSHFVNRVIILPEYKLGVIVLSNSSEANVWEISHKALNMMLQSKAGISWEYFQQETTSEQVKLSEQELKKYVGTYYEQYDLHIFEIKLKHRRLVLSPLFAFKFPGIEIELIPLKNGGLKPRAMVLGLWPINLDRLARGVGWYNRINHLYFTFHEINGMKVIAANRNGFEIFFASRIDPVAIPDAWMKRLGNYELLNPDENFKHDRKSSLFIRNAFLISRLSEGFQPIVRAVKPISDTEAVVMVWPGGMGDVITIIKQNNGEILCDSGFQYRRLK